MHKKQIISYEIEKYYLENYLLFVNSCIYTTYFNEWLKSKEAPKSEFEEKQKFSMISDYSFIQQTSKKIKGTLNK